MNKFAKLCAVEKLSGPKTCYYSIHVEDKSLNEVEDFFTRHENEEYLRDDLDEMFDWLDGIATITGALEVLFRHERKAGALPPENRDRKFYGKRLNIEYHEINRLRLYVIRLNQHVVILLNGGEKSQRDPEKCPNVRKYFREAQIIATAIDEAFSTKDIIYNTNNTDIIFNPKFEIQLS